MTGYCNMSRSGWSDGQVEGQFQIAGARSAVLATRKNEASTEFRVVAKEVAGEAEAIAGDSNAGGVGRR